MPKRTDNDALTIRAINRTTTRTEITLLALNHITSEHSLEYFKDLSKEDIPHNLDNLFTELRTIYDLIHEEMEGIRDYKLDLEEEVERNVQ